jgi:fructose-bisphosphate aldolase class I
MDNQSSIGTASALIATGKGLPAFDKSMRTCDKRFERLRISQATEVQLIYGELIITAAGLGKSISGASGQGQCRSKIELI